MIARGKSKPLRTSFGIGHNGGPLLRDERHVPEWGRGSFKTFFAWKAAHRAAWQVSRGVAMRRLERAEQIGLTYDEYTLEILERGRHLSLPDDAVRVAAIKSARRGQRKRNGGQKP